MYSCSDLWAFLPTRNSQSIGFDCRAIGSSQHALPAKQNAQVHTVVVDQTIERRTIGKA